MKSNRTNSRYVAAFLLAALVLQKADAGPGDFQEISLRRTEENHLFTNARINGKRAVVLVDTGWSRTTWNVGTNETGSATNISSLRLGDATIQNIPVLARAVRFDNQPASFTLVLGLDFLVAHRAVIDCERRKLFLPKNGAGFFPTPDPRGAS